MASILNVDQINNAAGTSAIGINSSSGLVTFPNSVTIPNGATMPTGSVVQVVSRIGGNDVNTATSGAWVASNLDLSITPNFSNSKFFISGLQLVRFVGSSGSVRRGGIRVVRKIGAGSYTDALNTAGMAETFQVRDSTSVGQELSDVFGFSFLDSPTHSGSVVTYNVEGWHQPDTGASSMQLWSGARGSAITIMEIAG